jgi:hypothetical protein
MRAQARKSMKHEAHQAHEEVGLAVRLGALRVSIFLFESLFK